ARGRRHARRFCPDAWHGGHFRGGRRTPRRRSPNGYVQLADGSCGAIASAADPARHGQGARQTAGRAPGANEVTAPPRTHPPPPPHGPRNHPTTTNRPDQPQETGPPAKEPPPNAEGAAKFGAPALRQAAEQLSPASAREGTGTTQSIEVSLISMAATPVAI